MKYTSQYIVEFRYVAENEWIEAKNYVGILFRGICSRRIFPFGHANKGDFGNESFFNLFKRITS